MKQLMSSDAKYNDLKESKISIYFIETYFLILINVFVSQNNFWLLIIKFLQFSWNVSNPLVFFKSGLVIDNKNFDRFWTGPDL